MVVLLNLLNPSGISYFLHEICARPRNLFHSSRASNVTQGQNVCWKYQANTWAKKFFFSFFFSFYSSFPLPTHPFAHKALVVHPNPTLTSDDSRYFLQRTKSRLAVRLDNAEVSRTVQGRPVGPPHEELLVYWSDTKTTFGNVNYLKDKRDSRVLFETEENNEV